MTQPSQREQHLQADADSARQQSYNMTIEARREKTRAEHLEAINTKLLAALEGLFTIIGEALIEGDFDGYPNKADIEAQHELARAAIQATKGA